jgi:hypothetical protein
MYRGRTCNEFLENFRVDEFLKMLHVQKVFHEVDGLVEARGVDVGSLAEDLGLDSISVSRGQCYDFKVNILRQF